MKKTTLLAVLLALVIGSFAQKDFQLGLQFSPSIGWLKPVGDNIEADGAKIGYTFGVIGDFNISDNYIFSTGIQLVNTGFTAIKPDVQEVTNTQGDLENGYGSTVADVRLNYIEVPLTLKLRTNEVGYMKYYAQVGLGLAANYRALADEKFTYVPANGNSSQPISNEEVDYNDEINLFRAALIIGAGVEYNLSGSTSLVAGVTFNNGFTNIFSKDVYSANGAGNVEVPAAGEPEPGRSKSAKSINNMIVLNIGLLF
ncbi:MAG: hypothetical protein ACJAV5_001270 [Vicingaceae bacterium]|jgi:hypothetical protein